MTKQEVMEWLEAPQTKALLDFLQRELEDLDRMECYVVGDPFLTAEKQAERAAAMRQTASLMDVLENPDAEDFSDIWGADE